MDRRISRLNLHEFLSAQNSRSVRQDTAEAAEAGANDPADEANYFFVCKTCGQAVDMRELDQIFHHQIPGHEPMPTE